MTKLCLLLILGTTTQALAEYRVFQYLVKNTALKAQDQNAYLAISTLDPISYRSYKAGSLNIKVDLMRTWICPGYTGMNQDYCASPYEKVKEQVQ